MTHLLFCSYHENNALALVRAKINDSPHDYSVMANERVVSLSPGLVEERKVATSIFYLQSVFMPF